MGCFQFIENWLERRKARRRAKKRRAISARAERSTASVLKRKGVAFEVPISDRPPTPFRGLTPKPGKGLVSAEERRLAYENAVARRQAILNEKTRFAREDALRRAKVQLAKTGVANDATDASPEADEVEAEGAQEEGVVPFSED